jgi:capsular polysaccharide biosynthesis protein
VKQRVIEVLFRHLFLLLLPLIVILPVTAYLTLRSRSVQWQSVSTAWVNQATAISTQDHLGNTPAPTQATLLANFIQTRTFAHAVLAQTPLASELDGGAGEAAAIADFQKAVAVAPSGNQFVTITVKETSPELAYAVSEALIAEFAQQIQQEANSESQSSVTLAQDAYNKASAQYTTSLNALATYLGQHPDIANPAANSTGPGAQLIDPAYAQLLNQASSDQAAYDGAKQRFDDAKQQAQGGAAALPFTFTLVDQPQKPTMPIVEKKTALLRLPAIGLAVALMLSTVVGIYLILADRRIFGADDLDALGLTVLGTLPDLDSRWRRRDRESVRRRIAGPARGSQQTTLPAPPRPAPPHRDADVRPTPTPAAQATVAATEDAPRPAMATAEPVLHPVAMSTTLQPQQTAYAPTRPVAASAAQPVAAASTRAPMMTAGRPSLRLIARSTTPAASATLTGTSLSATTAHSDARLAGS